MFIAAKFTIDMPRYGNNINVHPQINGLRKYYNVHTMYYILLKQKGNLELCNNINHEVIILSEISQSQKEKNYMISLHNKTL